jgi:hypothetical protein
MAPNSARAGCTQRFSRAGQRLAKQRDAEHHPYHAPLILMKTICLLCIRARVVISTNRSDFAGSLSQYLLHAAGVRAKGWTPTKLAP